VTPVSKWAPSPRSAASLSSTAKAPTAAKNIAPRGEIVLVGLRVDAALPEVERAINEALLSGKGSLRVVHGFGSGRLAAAVREFLSDHPGVASHRPGDAQEGGEAATIAELKD
jgi:DNA mismatch repair protein MutS2